MDKQQRKILEFLSKRNASDYVTLDEISSNTKIERTEAGSECLKLREIEFLESTSGPGTPLSYRITARGVIHLDIERDKKITSKATIVLAIATVALAAGTIILAMNSSHQTDLMQHDFDVNNRPWIGGLNFTVSHEVVIYDYQNFGKIPNTGGQIAFLVSTSPITRDMLKSNMTKTIPMQILMPSEKLTSIFNGAIEEGIKSAQEGKNDLYLGVSFTYDYGSNKSGDYNVISHYNPKDNTMDLIDSWID